MNDSLPPGPPTWVHKRDGQLVPFDADKISRALFAAAESLGHPDAFLARELADAVVHFLTIENEGVTPSTEQLAELVIKVVRELGQPALAEAFARFRESRSQVSAKPQAAEAAPSTEIVLRFDRGTPLSAVLPSCVREYALQTVFTRDLVAAQSAGLLTLTGLDTPTELASCVLGPPLDPVSRADRRHRGIAAFRRAFRRVRWSGASPGGAEWASGPRFRPRSRHRSASDRPACDRQSQQRRAAVMGGRTGRGTPVRRPATKVAQRAIE